MVFDRLQFRETSLFASPQIRHSVAQLFKREKAFLIGREQALDAISTTREIATQRFFPALGRIGLSCGLEPAIELFLYETWLFEQARNRSVSTILRQPVLEFRLGFLRVEMGG